MQFFHGLGSEDLNTLTVCLRFNVEYLRPVYTMIFSYSTFITDNCFESFLWLESATKLSFSFCKYCCMDGVTSICSEFTMKSVKIHDHWHHACWSFETNEIDSDQIEISTKLFFDGIEVNQGDSPIVNSFLAIKYCNINSLL